MNKIMEKRIKRSLCILMCLASLCAMGGYGCSRITASAGPGGTISPTGTVWVWKGSSKTFTMSPASGNTIADVSVDGTSLAIGSSTTYTFTNVQGNHTILVSYVTDTTHYRIFNAIYNTAGTRLDNSCQVCHDPHANPTTSEPLVNAYGRDVLNKRTAGYTKYQSLKLIEPNDSDADGFSNIAEINAGKFPGDPNDHP